MSANVERVLAEIDQVPIPAESRSYPVIEWEKPGRIESRLTPVPALPEELIPGPFRKWIVDIAHRMQAPPDFAAITAMTVAASVIGAGCAIRPKRRDNWEVVPNLWGACIGRPSVVLKSPSMKEPIDMLSRLQADAREVHKEEIKAYQFDQQVKEAQRKQLEKDIQKIATAKVKDPAKLDALKNDYLTDEDDEEPVQRLFKTNETSIQSQTVLQVQNPRGLLTFRDELTGLLTRWDRREYEDERAYFLEGFNGDGSYTDYKIGRGLTDAENICISLFGSIQPDKLRRYLHQSMTGGNDGLMQRFQLAVYPDEPKNWRLIDEYPNVREKDRAYEVFRALAEASFTQWDAQQGEYEKRPYMRFTDEGQEVFNEWLTDLQTDKLPSEENPLIAEHLGKYRSLMPSLALIIHLIGVADNSADGQVSEQVAIQAAAWCEYLEAHARRIYGMVTEPGQQAAVILADRIRAGNLANSFTARDVYRNHWSGLTDRAAVDAACMVLIDEDWLFMEQSKSTGGRPPLPKFWVNPAVVGEL